MWEGFQTKWHVHLGGTSFGKRQIKLTPEKYKPGHCAPYRKRPKAQEVEKSENDKMLKMKVVEAAETGPPQL